MKLLNIDLTQPLPCIPAATAGEQWLLVRLHGAPIGILHLEQRPYEPAQLAGLIATTCRWPIMRHLVADGITAAQPTDLLHALADLPGSCPQLAEGVEWPPLSVAVCTRDGAGRLAECLDALAGLDYPAALLDVTVVDNAPGDDSTSRLLRERYPRMRYVLEPRPGLDWARNRAVLEARGEIVAFTDDDVSVDPGWAKAIARVFVDDPGVMAVTGLVVPDEIESEPQKLFEQYGGFGRGFSRTYAGIDLRAGDSAAALHGGTGKFGTGANMAFRRNVFERIGLFDPALDVGTATNGGGDLEMFFRVIKHGHMLVYEPSAIVRHRHRREYAQLRTQLANNGIGFYSYLVRTAAAFRDERWAVLRLGVWWLWYWNLRRYLRSFVRTGFPRDLIAAEMRGSLAGLRRYGFARRQAAAVQDTFGPQRPLMHGDQA